MKPTTSVPARQATTEETPNTSGNADNNTSIIISGRFSVGRLRRGRADMKTLRDRIMRLLTDEHPMTLRQLYYRLVCEGVIHKTEAEYAATAKLTATMRREGTLPYKWIADNTRWMRKPRTYTALSAMLQETVRTYRRNLWSTQPAYVEIWLEKDALAGVIYGVTSEWDVPLQVTRGYPSLSFLHSAGEEIRHQGKPTFLYYLGDHDPSGVHIPVKVEQEIRQFAPEADIHFKRIAVNKRQIEEFGLVTRPTKKSDSRSKGFKGESVEVDAIPPAVLRGLVSTAITQHIDQRELERLRETEHAERGTLEEMCQNLAM